MGRSGYNYDGIEDQWAFIRWRGVVASSIRGKRGQAFLRELLQALDEMPEKRLIAHDLRRGGEVCAIGSVGAKRGVDMEKIDPEDFESVAAAFGIASPLVQEIEYINDDDFYGNDPAARWRSVRAWVASQIKDPRP